MLGGLYCETEIESTVGHALQLYFHRIALLGNSAVQEPRRSKAFAL